LKNGQVVLDRETKELRGKKRSAAQGRGGKRKKTNESQNNRNRGETTRSKR